MTTLAGQILYTEDDADTRELVSYVLGMSNYRVMAAENNDRALLLARSNQFDLYMIDNWMPGGSGIDLCKKLREFDPLTPILFYSGAARDRDKQEAFGSGAQGYLIKPVDNDELINEVFRLIDEARNGKRNNDRKYSSPARPEEQNEIRSGGEHHEINRRLAGTT
jgi:DNA-binding response OmpR family regulator